YKYTDPDGREVVQVGVSFALPEVMGTVQKLMGKSLNISGFSAGVAWSSPSIDGHGEFDIGIYMTTRLNGEGADTGRFAATYSQSLDDGATVKDLAGIGGGASVGFGAGGIDASYSQDGIEMMGMHIGPGAGVTVQGQATAIMSAKHGKIGWNKSSSGTRAVSSNRKKEQQ
ncbi:MAG: hypothetical protein V7700_18495, partial [Halioglobus sp.]